MTSIRRALVLGTFALAAGFAGPLASPVLAAKKAPMGPLLDLGSPALVIASVTPAASGAGGTPPEGQPPASPTSPKTPPGPVLGP